MSSLSLKKLKQKLSYSPNLLISQQTVVPACQSPSFSANKQTPKESSRMTSESVACGFTIVNGVQVPITSTTLIPIIVQTVPASTTTAQRIEATLLAETDPTKTDLRFLEYFPPPVPPPQFLQPGFVKYKYSYEPVTPQRPCIGYRSIEP